MSALYRHGPRRPLTAEEQAAKRVEFDRVKAEYQASPERAAMLAERVRLQAEYDNRKAGR